MAEEKNIALLALTLLSTAMLIACSTKLKDIDKEGISYIIEVEKVARDAYQYFYDKWGIPLMRDISISEQAHMDMVKKLVETYNIDNPTEGNDYGEFTNSQLQQLYYDLIEQGSSSEDDAIAIAAMIEEIDIVDIKRYHEQTENDDIDTTYSDLTIGSRVHLQKFVSLLKDKGLEYQPNYLSKEEYNQIIAHITITTPTTTTTTTGSSDMSSYMCSRCGYIYDPQWGDPLSGIPPGTPFEELPNNWSCPDCGVPKSDFFKIDY